MAKGKCSSGSQIWSSQVHNNYYNCQMEINVLVVYKIGDQVHKINLSVVHKFDDP